MKKYFLITLSISMLAAAGIQAEDRPILQMNSPSYLKDKLALNVNDLGFSQTPSQEDLHIQNLLDRRSHMLQIHQRWALATAVGMLATLSTAGDTESRSGRNVHMAAALTTTALYMTAASYAMRAPSVPGYKKKGATKIHQALAFVHFPGMILTPILGIMARRQLNNGEDTHGAARYHSQVANVTAAAFFASLVVITINF